jgi:hypothetical protein
MKYKGMNYDLGWNNGSPEHAADPIEQPSLVKDLTAIRDGLNGNAVNIMGTDIAQLARAGEVALEAGLQLWLQPRLIDNPEDRTLDHVAETAQVAERLRERYGNVVVLNAGCELVLLAGFIAPPGDDLMQRLRLLMTPDGHRNVPEYYRKVDAYLADACTIAKKHFNGPVTYASSDGEWDAVDWSRFDIVNLDHYLNAENEGTYRDAIGQFRRFGKPIVVGEFGCGCFEGSDKLGGMSWDVVDWEKDPPELDNDYVRNEQVQADYANTVLSALEAEGVEGAFWYQFIQRDTPRTGEGRFDLEMASYGVVTPFPEKTDDSGAMYWEAKPAFREIARHFAKA